MQVEPIPALAADVSPRGGGASNVPVAVIRRAAALRMKYRRHPNLVRIPVMQVGPHPDNRDGQGPSGSRCLELTGKILSVRFDAVEAGSNGVLVEPKPGCTRFRDAYKRFAEGDSLLAPNMGGAISFGSLSHGTLNQLMRNINARCTVAASAQDASNQQVASAVVEEEPLSRIVDS